MIRYVFKDENVVLKNAGKADPQVIGEALAEISAENAGRLKPDDVWRAAQIDEHPLHDFYEWDVQKAAEKHWRDQSRALIRSIRVESEDAETSRPAFLSVHQKDGTSYHSIDSVTASRQLQLSVLRQAERDLKAFEKRYEELVEICDVVRDLRGNVRSRIAEMEERAQA